MSKYLKMNEKMIIREEDKMIFSAKKMQIYKFNEKGFKIVNYINENNDLKKDELLSIFSKEYTNDEINNLINKMISNDIIIEYEE